MRRLRLPAAVTLAAVLLCSPWLACLPLCVIEGHGDMVMAGAHHVMHLAPCHSGRAVRHEISVATPPVTMLPSASAPALPPLLVTALPQVPAASIHVQQIPSADPPPPRSA